MLNKLPQGWIECQLGDLLFLQNGYAFISNDYEKTGTPIVRISDIKNNKIFLEDTVKYNKNNIDKCFHIEKGDFLIAMSGATTGKTGVYYSDKPAFLNQRVGNLKIFSDRVLLPQYRNYFIADKRNLIEKLAYGGAQPNISKQMIESLEILLPPLNEQKRIVEKIECEFEKINSSIEKLTLTQEQIKQYKQSVLKSAFEGNLYKTTKWEEKTLEEFCPILYGKSLPKKERAEGGVPVFASSGLVGYHNKPLINYPCLIIGRKGNVGSVYYTNKPSWIIDTAYYTTHDTKINLFYQYYLLLNLNLSKLNQSTAIPGLSRDLYNKTQVQVTFDIDEQQKIVEEIEKRFSVADNVLEIVNDSLEKAKQLKQSILKKAFEGRLVPQDPTDEPASKLLERIKAEREKK